MQVVHSREELAEVMDAFDAYSLSEKAFPLLLDRFLEGMEVEVDAVTDGRDVMIPVLIQHVERAGVHSGDSISLLPALDLTASQKEAIAEYTRRIARALPHRGLLNIQFIVRGDEVYCLEVNPRASRTVPVVSKVMGVPMIGWATRVQLGESLRSFAPTGLLPPPEIFAAKGPVFSAAKLPGVDPALGPSMKSTGEVLGLGDAGRGGGQGVAVRGRFPPAPPRTGGVGGAFRRRQGETGSGRNRTGFAAAGSLPVRHSRHGPLDPCALGGFRRGAETG